MSDFKGRHFEGEVVLWAVRWYCRYGVSYRDLEQMMGERGVSVGRCHENGIWPRTIGSPSSSSGRGDGSPSPERLFSEGAERVTGCEMALDVEGVVDGGVNRQEALC